MTEITESAKAGFELRNLSYQLMTESVWRIFSTTF